MTANLRRPLANAAYGWLLASLAFSLIWPWRAWSAQLGRGASESGTLAGFESWQGLTAVGMLVVAGLAVQLRHRGLVLASALVAAAMLANMATARPTAAQGLLVTEWSALPAAYVGQALAWLCGAAAVLAAGPAPATRPGVEAAPAPSPTE